METPQAVDALAAEFADHQSLSETNIHKTVWDKALEEPDDADSYIRMDKIWAYISCIDIPGTSSKRFKFLSKVTFLVLTIPHSNAG